MPATPHTLLLPVVDNVILTALPGVPQLAVGFAALLERQHSQFVFVASAPLAVSVAPRAATVGPIPCTGALFVHRAYVPLPIGWQPPQSPTYGVLSAAPLQSFVSYTYCAAPSASATNFNEPPVESATHTPNVFVDGKRTFIVHAESLKMSSTICVTAVVAVVAVIVTCDEVPTAAVADEHSITATLSWVTSSHVAVVVPTAPHAELALLLEEIDGVPSPAAAQLATTAPELPERQQSQCVATATLDAARTAPTRAVVGVIA